MDPASTGSERRVFSESQTHTDFTYHHLIPPSTSSCTPLATQAEPELGGVRVCNPGRHARRVTSRAVPVDGGSAGLFRARDCESDLSSSTSYSRSPFRLFDPSGRSDSGVVSQVSGLLPSLALPPKWRTCKWRGIRGSQGQLLHGSHACDSRSQAVVSRGFESRSRKNPALTAPWLVSGTRRLSRK